MTFQFRASRSHACVGTFGNTSSDFKSYMLFKASHIMYKVLYFVDQYKNPCLRVAVKPYWQQLKENQPLLMIYKIMLSLLTKGSHIQHTGWGYVKVLCIDIQVMHYSLLNNTMRLIYGLTLMLFFSCTNKAEDQKILNSVVDAQITGENFEREIQKYIEKSNFNDSVSLMYDSLFFFPLRENEFSVALGQYHTSDNKIYFSIIGIVNFNNENMPTYLLTDQMKRQFKPDSVTVENDSVFIYGQTKTDLTSENFKIGFDLKFDGSKFPWSYEY